MFIAWLNPLDGENWPEELQRYLLIKPDIDVKENWEHHPHALTLYQSILDLNAQVVVEIGTRKWLSTRIIIEALRKTRGHLWTIDKESYPHQLSTESDIQFVTVIVSRAQDVKWETPIDLFFIDSSHEYIDTIEQMDKFYPFLKSPGIMIVADSDAFFEQKRAVQDWAEKRRLGYILDMRAQGAAYFLRPEYPKSPREILQGKPRIDYWSTIELKAS